MACWPNGSSTRPARTAKRLWSPCGRATTCSTPGSLPPERDALTASDVHDAVDYRPIVCYDLVGGYTNLPGLTALAATKEDRP